MKKLSYFVFLIISFIFLSFNVSADTKVVVINGDSVRFRSSATIYTNNIIREFNNGAELDLIDENIPSGNGCDDKWYKASYSGTTGYICSEFATIKVIKEIDPSEYQDYTEYLKELGFPDSYIPKLIALHNSHPTWQFKVFKTDLEFSYMNDLEYTKLGKGWSLIEDTGRYIDGYKSTESWSYDYLTDVFNNKFDGGGSAWYAPRKDVIAYYMDPRNFLTEKQIFMFETLSYNKSYQTRDGVEAILKNTFMTGYADNEETKTYTDAFMDAASKYNVSPYLLVSRVIQEVGANGSTIVSGKVVGYEGYYNFYNIKATGSQSEIITNGLKYAKEKGWDSPYKAILGGAEFLAKDYINVGQDTLYLQKWDLIVPNPGRHQYMQNIEAPYYEAIKTYNSYNNRNTLGNSFVFSIPVYKNMPDKTILPSSKNPNNYLSTLSVNGSYLFEKPTTNTSFDLVLDAGTSSVNIVATKVNSAATIEGTGSVSIPNEKQTINITVTAGNGDKRIYKINITKKQAEVTNDAPALDISEILRVLNIKNDGTYFYGYEINTDVSKIIKSITDKESKATVTYTNKNNESKTTGIIASGDKLKIKTDREEKTYTLIIYGDVNGDGKIAATDYVAIKNHIMDIKKLNDFEKLCADANRDGKVLATDYVAIKNHIMDVKKITQ